MMGMGMGMPVEKSKNFGVSFRRLVGRLRPERPRIVGSGTHRQLLETCETYREIVYSQLSEAEAVA